MQNKYFNPRIKTSMIVLVTFLTSLAGTAQSRNYYLSNNGSDSNDGSMESPWSSLSKISAVSLNPGDSVLFRRGDRFDGRFVVNGSGEDSNPIVISAYGEGERPIITGEVGESGGGDYREAIYVLNEDNMVFDNLEIQNERLSTRAGIDDTDAYGIFIHNTSGRMENFLFQNLTFKDVYAVEPITNRDDFDQIQVSGLRFLSTKNMVNGQEKQIKNVEVKDSFFGNLQRFGIQFKHNRANDGVGVDSLNRIMNVHVHHNEFSYNGGTGVLPNGTYNCLIEYNLFDHPGSDNDPRMPARGSSIWNIWSINTIMQYNVCLSTRGYLDSHGIHVDNFNTNTFVQYNYMEDCEGGFVEILRGNKNAVYRFNVSLNDGFRFNETWRTSNHTIWVNAVRHNPETFTPNDSIFIHNNTVVINKPFTSGIDETSVTIDSDNLYIFNNIFTSTNGGITVGGHVSSNPSSRGDKFIMSNNLFDGNIGSEFMSWDANPFVVDPAFTLEGERDEAFKLISRSTGIGAGVNILGPEVPGAGKGVFKDISPYPTVDFYGNPVNLASGSINIGAYNGAGEEGNRPLNVDFGGNDTWTIYPNPAYSQLSIIKPKGLKGTVKLTLTNLKGQQIMRDNLNFSNQEKITLDLKPNVAKGIYLLNLVFGDKSETSRLIIRK
ncbi:MAG: T9SS type A sorting domain-containing protein [Bacteroidota bacterium]